MIGDLRDPLKPRPGRKPGAGRNTGPRAGNRSSCRVWARGRTTTRHTVRSCNMGVHRIFLSDDPDHAHLTPGATLDIAGQEAHHALRVKRLEVGDRLELLNGRGLRAVAMLAAADKIASGRGRPEWSVRLDIERVTEEPLPKPRLHVFACAPKLTRVEDMVDQLSQVGAAAWSPLVTTHTVAPPRAGKMDKLERVAVEASKQCGRSWLMAIGNPAPMAGVLSRKHREIGPATQLVIADPDGTPYRPTGAADIALLVGPEAGFTGDEVDAACRAGAVRCNIGPHLMRVGTAAVVASGIILNAERRP